MKRVLFLASLVLLISALLLPFCASASDYPQWDPTFGTYQIEMDGGSHVYRYAYQPSVDGKVAFITPRESTLHVSLYPSGTWDSIPVVRIFQDNYWCFVADVKAGTSYMLEFSPGGDYYGSVSVITKAWDDSMYETVTVDTTYTKSVTGSSSLTYLFTPQTSGIYTLQTESANAEVCFAAYPVYNVSPNPYPDPVYIEHIRDGNATYETSYLKAGVTYSIKMMGNSAEGTKTATFSIKAGVPEGRNHGILKVGEPFTVSVESGDFCCYAFVAPSTGKYTLMSNEEVRGYLCDAGSSVLVGKSFGSLYNQPTGTVYELVGGEVYVAQFDRLESGSGTATFCLEKMDSIRSGKIQILSFYGDSGTLMLKTDPLGAVADGVEWSVSDESVFSLNQFDEFVEFTVLKQGSAVITAKTGGKTFTLTLSTNPATPTLTTGKTETLFPHNAEQSAGYFTPATSGTYQFDIVPVTEGLRFALEKPDGGFLFDKRTNESITVTAELEAGKTYSVYMEQSVCELTITKIADAQPPQGPAGGDTEPTEPSEPAGSNDQTEPPQPTEDPTEPTQGNDGTQPTEPVETPTEPTQGTEQPGTEETKPSEPAETEPEKEPSADAGSTGEITQEDIAELLNDKNENVLHFTLVGTENRTFQIRSDALQLAAEKDCALNLEFIGDVSVQLSEAVVKYLHSLSAGEMLTVTVNPQPFSALNEAQTKAIDGLIHGGLWEVDISIGDTSVHDLKGNAEICLPNRDPAANWSVLYLAEDGTAEEMKITVDKNITVHTDHCSFFVLVSYPAEQTPAPSSSSGWWIAIVAVVVLSGGAIAFILWKKKASK